MMIYDEAIVSNTKVREITGEFIYQNIFIVNYDNFYVYIVFKFNYRTQERNNSMNRQSIDPRSPSYGGISSDPAPPFSSPEPRKSDFF